MGDIAIESENARLLKMRPSSLSGISDSVRNATLSTDIETFLRWVNEELQIVERLTDRVLLFESPHKNILSSFSNNHHTIKEGFKCFIINRLICIF